MGHDTHHPIRSRLTRALDAAVHSSFRRPVPPAFLPIQDEEDEERLREWVLRHHTQYGLDPIWILTGIGQEPSGAHPPAPALTPVFAMSTIDPRTGLWQPTAVECIALGPECISQGQFVVRMEDRSMEPRIRYGAYLIVDPEQVLLPEKPAGPQPVQPEGRIFALALPGEGLIARIAQVEKTMHRVILSALAEDYPPLFLSREAAKTLVKGRVIRLAQTI
jgi:hypothetical protein